MGRLVIVIGNPKRESDRQTLPGVWLMIGKQKSAGVSSADRHTPKNRRFIAVLLHSPVGVNDLLVLVAANFALDVNW